MPTLVTPGPAAGYGVFTPICGAPVAAARGPRLLRASTNRNQLDETYSILRYSGEISYRFIAAFRGAENSSEAIRSISLFNLRLLTSSRTAAFSSFVLAIAVCWYPACSHNIDRLYMGSSPHRFRPNFGRHWALLTPPVQPRGRTAKASSIEPDVPRSSKLPKVRRGRWNGGSFNLSERYHHSSSVERCFQ
jgi:hypothetical protein